MRPPAPAGYSLLWLVDVAPWAEMEAPASLSVSHSMRTLPPEPEWSVGFGSGEVN